MGKFMYKSVLVALFGLFAGCDGDDAEIVLPESLLTVNPEEIVFQQEGGTEELTVTTNRGWTIEKGEGAWFKIENDDLGKEGEYAIQLLAADNPETEKRTSKVVVRAGVEKKELSVTQFGSEPDMVIPEKEVTVEYAGGIRPVIVHSNTEVTLDPEDSWIKVAQGLTMSMPSNTFLLNVDLNEGVRREGTVVVKAGAKEERITVIQEAWKAEMSLSQGTLMVGSQRLMGSVGLTTSGPWSLEFEGGEKPAWIISAPTNGNKGSVELVFGFTPNDTEGVRECKVIIRCGEEKLELTIVHDRPTLRERDSLMLMALYNKANSRGTQNWDFTRPMSEWTGVELGSGDERRVIKLRMDTWKFGDIPAELGELDGLTHLTFYACTFTNPLLPEIGELKALSEFTCIGVEAVKFPASVSGCTSLKLVHLAGIFQSMGAHQVMRNTEIAEGLCHIPSLERLTLNYTDVENIPDAIGDSNIAFLSILEGKLQAIPAVLGSMQKLKYLTIRNSGVGGTIPAALFSAPEMISCILTGNRLEGEIPVEAYRAPKLSELGLANNLLTGDLSVELVSSNIQMISVNLNRLGGPGARLDDAIKNDPRFKNATGWGGIANICVQHEGYGWVNCEN